MYQRIKAMNYSGLYYRDSKTNVLLSLFLIFPKSKDYFFWGGGINMLLEELVSLAEGSISTYGNISYI